MKVLFIWPEGKIEELAIDTSYLRFVYDLPINRRRTSFLKAEHPPELLSISFIRFYLDEIESDIRGILTYYTDGKIHGKK